MTGLEAGAPATAGMPATMSGAAKFVGQDRIYWRLLIRGAVLLMITFGIYRFWLTTDIRRFLWANTEIAGESVEYTGTARELLIGFLIAVALLVPIYAAFFVAALDWGLFGKLSGLVGFLLLAVLGQFAVYRARRYRLSRTIYRGVHLHQTGSGWRYALYALCWWVTIVATIGLVYPWAQATLERYKMRNTHYGNLSGEFAGLALSLFLRGFPMWLLIVAPLFLGLGASAFGIDWTALAEAAGHDGSDLAARIESSNPGFDKAIVFAIMGCTWAGLAATMLYPTFQALLLRWWVSGLRFDAVAARSRLRTGQVYRAYFRFLLYGGAFAVAVGLVAAAGLGLGRLLDGSLMTSTTADIAMTAIFVIGYVAIALGFSAIYQGTIKLSLWRLAVESLELSGITALEHVKATGKPSSALGEGLADALHVGGF